MRFGATVARGDSVIIDRPPLSTSLTECLVAEGYAKLVRQRLGRYRIIGVGPEYVRIWQHGIENTASIDRIKRTLRANEEENNDVADETPKSNSEKKPSEPKKKPEQEYVVEQIVDHKKTKKSIRYQVRRYGYEPTDDTYELASQIRTNFIHRYWKRETKRKDNRRFSRHTNWKSQKGGKQLTKKLGIKTLLATDPSVSAIGRPLGKGIPSEGALSPVRLPKSLQ